MAESSARPGGRRGSLPSSSTDVERRDVSIWKVVVFGSLALLATMTGFILKDLSGVAPIDTYHATPQLSVYLSDPRASATITPPAP